MGSACAKGVSIHDLQEVPDGIKELKKRQFTEDWKRRYSLELNCFFSTVDSLCQKKYPAVKGYRGIIVVKLTLINNDPKHSKLNSILHMPVLQWHGIDIKLQLPRHMPLNLWEGEYTGFAFYRPETSTGRGFCTVSGKIGKEQILLEKELQYGYPLPAQEWKSISKKLEIGGMIGKIRVRTGKVHVHGHLGLGRWTGYIVDETELQIHQAHTKKKIKVSVDRVSQRESRDTGYTSEHPPYPALRYSERDTDSESQSEEQRQREKKSKIRRKDTPSYHGRPVLKNPLKNFNIPLIEELEMNQGSSDELSEGEGKANEEVSEQPVTKVKKCSRPSIRDESPRLSNKSLNDAGRKASSVSVAWLHVLDSRQLPKRKSRSLADIPHMSEFTSPVQSDTASYHSDEKGIVRPKARRKKKSLCMRLRKESSVINKSDEPDQIEKSMEKVKKECTSADDADDEGDIATNIKTNMQHNSHQESADLDAGVSYSHSKDTDTSGNITHALADTIQGIEVSEKGVQDRSGELEGMYEPENDNLYKGRETNEIEAGELRDNVNVKYEELNLFSKTTELETSKARSRNEDPVAKENVIDSECTSVMNKDLSFEDKTETLRIGDTIKTEVDAGYSVNLVTKSSSADLAASSSHVVASFVNTDPVNASFEDKNIVDQSQDDSFRELNADCEATQERSKAHSFSVKEKKVSSPRKFNSFCVTDFACPVRSKGETATGNMPPISAKKAFHDESGPR